MDNEMDNEMYNEYQKEWFGDLDKGLESIGEVGISISDISDIIALREELKAQKAKLDAEVKEYAKALAKLEEEIIDGLAVLQIDSFKSHDLGKVVSLTRSRKYSIADSEKFEAEVARRAAEALAKGEDPSHSLRWLTRAINNSRVKEEVDNYVGDKKEFLEQIGLSEFEKLGLSIRSI